MTLQTCESRSPKPRRQVQEIEHALYTDGEYLALPPRMRTTASEHALAR